MSSASSVFDRELEALRNALTMLSTQLTSIDDEIAHKHELIVAAQEHMRTKAVQSETLLARAAEIRFESNGMRRCIAHIDELNTLRGNLQWAQREGKEREALIEVLSDQIVRELPRTHRAACLRAAASLGRAAAYLDSDLLPYCEIQRSSGSYREERLLTTGLSGVFSTMEDIFVARESILRLLCDDVDHRTTESERFNEVLPHLEADAVSATEALLGQKQQLIDAVSIAFSHEVEAIRGEMSKATLVHQELHYHQRRGTSAKKTTKLTPNEQRMQRVVDDLRDEVKLLRERFEQVRAERSELERQAERAYESLLRNREGHQKAREQLRVAQEALRVFLSQLGEEHQDWVELRKELQNLVLQRRRQMITDGQQRSRSERTSLGSKGPFS